MIFLMFLSSCDNFYFISTCNLSSYNLWTKTVLDVYSVNTVRILLRTFFIVFFFNVV